MKINDYDVGVSSSTSNERILFIAVILQALLDATKAEETNESDIAIQARDRAKGWVFAEVGVTCENFEFVCDMANLDSEYTRSFAYKIITSKPNTYIRKKINALLRG